MVIFLVLAIIDPDVSHVYLYDVVSPVPPEMCIERVTELPLHIVVSFGIINFNGGLTFTFTKAVSECNEQLSVSMQR